MKKSLRKRKARSVWENELGRIIDKFGFVEREIENSDFDGYSISELMKFKNLIDSRMRRLVVKAKTKQKQDIKERKRKRVEEDLKKFGMIKDEI